MCWIKQLSAKSLEVAGQLIGAFALQLRLKQALPLTTLYIEGQKNAMMNVPSCSFGCEPKWHYDTDADLFTLFNTMFPLPNQASWTIFRPSYEAVTQVTSILWMEVSLLVEWRQLSGTGKHSVPIDAPTFALWE